jgi:histidinol-phosphate/aromatic aminotransferase/cobyric acid decarboxylase-like protein/choline kinase
MQAIILAAGMGKRLGKLTRRNTKCMIEVNGERLIDRVLTQLSKLNLKRIIIVVGYQADNLSNHIKSLNIERPEIQFILNPVYDRTNNIYSLALAKQQLMEDDTLLLESDLIFDDRMFSLIMDDPYPNLALVAKYETWMDGTMVRIDENNNIVSFVPKTAFKFDEVSSYYKTVNIYKFSKEFSSQYYVPFLEAYTKAVGDNEYYEQVLRVITMLDRVNFKALPITDEKWYEIDDIQDLDIAETIFANEDEKLQKYCQRYGGYWRFPMVKDFCYLVNPYFPPHKMIDEIKSNFMRLITEYPSGMKVNSLLAGKYFNINEKYICVGNGASELIKSLAGYLDGKIGMTFPTFEEYPNRLNFNSIVQYEPSNKDFSYSADSLKSYFESKDISYLLLVNPDNPSGNFIKCEDVLELAKWARERNIKLILDESFVDFSEGTTNNSLLRNDILETNPNLIIIKSVSKSYGVPGLRLGVLAAGDERLISNMKKDLAIWNINSFAEFYMQIYNKYSTYYSEACLKLVQERNRFYNNLQDICYLRIIPSQANYFLCEVTGKICSSELTKLLLLKHNILVKDCSKKKSLEGKSFIRIAIRNREDNDILLEALREIQ